MLSPRFTNLVQHIKNLRLASKWHCQIRQSLPKVFPHCVPNQNKPNAIYSSYRMSQSSAQCQPMISELLQGTFHPFSLSFGKAFHLTNCLSTVGKRWGWIPHQSGQKSNEHWNNSLGNFGYGWGRWGKAGNDNCLLQNWWNLWMHSSP